MPNIEDLAAALRPHYTRTQLDDIAHSLYTNDGNPDAEQLINAAKLAASEPGCRRCHHTLDGRGFCKRCTPGVAPPPYVEVDRETAYGTTARMQRPVRVF